MKYPEFSYHKKLKSVPKYSRERIKASRCFEIKLFEHVYSGYHLNQNDIITKTKLSVRIKKM